MVTEKRIKRNKDYLVWIDCEMTGLDPERHVLLEIATIITDKDLKIIAEGPVLAIRQSESKLRQMDRWCWRTHGKSGLIERVRKSGVSEGKAERQTLGFLRRYCYKRTAPLCGNSIGQDKRFLAKYMPTLCNFFHYQVVDVSSVKVLATRWYGKKYTPPEKSETHRALSDIKESIAELEYYRQKVFVRS